MGAMVATRAEERVGGGIEGQGKVVGTREGGALVTKNETAATQLTTIEEVIVAIETTTGAIEREEATREVKLAGESTPTKRTTTVVMEAEAAVEEATEAEEAIGEVLELIEAPEAAGITITRGTVEAIGKAG